MKQKYKAFGVYRCPTELSPIRDNMKLIGVYSTRDKARADSIAMGERAEQLGSSALDRVGKLYVIQMQTNEINLSGPEMVVSGQQVWPMPKEVR